jgi:polyphosphate kinase
MRMYISSADLMTRNTEHRVEIACPIFDRQIKQKIYSMLTIRLKDNVKGRQLQNDGTYSKRMEHAKKIDSQQYFMDAFNLLEINHNELES